MPARAEPIPLSSHRVVETRNCSPLGPNGFRCRVHTAVVTRNCSPLGPSLSHFLVTTAVVTRNCCPRGPRRLTLLVTTHPPGGKRLRGSPGINRFRRRRSLRLMWSLWSSWLLPSVTSHPPLGKKDTWRHPFKCKMKWTNPPFRQQKTVFVMSVFSPDL